MEADELRAFCLSFNAATEEFPFPSSPELCTFKVLGKIFALGRLDERPLRIALKAEPEDVIRLRKQHAAIVQGPYLSSRHWNTVTVDELPDGFVRELVEDSYDLVVAGLPKAERLRLDRP